MLKNKGLILVFLTALIAVAVFTGVGISIAGRNSQAFAGDGYILSSEASGNEGANGTDGESAPGQLYFAAGTKYKNRYPESAVFKDIQGSRQTIAAQSFVHYADDSLSALTDGVVINIDDINTGIANHYGVKSGVVMAKDAGGYSVENNGNSIEFTNLMWKLSDTRFLVASDGMVLSLPDGSTKTISGALEAEYVEDGIVCLMDTENKWQVVSDGTSVTFSDGVAYDFGTKIIKDANGTDRMTFQELLLDADDNIRVQSAEEWKAPEFDFQVVDGQDGEKGKTGDQGITGVEGQEGETGAAGNDGTAGDDGQAGEDGDDGDDGDDGSTGGKGRSGSSGSNGAKGAQGSMGHLTNADTVPQASFTLTAFDLTAGTLDITFEVADEGPVLPDTAEDASGVIRLLDPQGNEMEWESTGSESLVYSDNGNLIFQDGSEYGISWKNLNPDTEYRLVVSSGYSLKNVQGKRDYINRTFYTDSTGLQLEKTYATETGFAMTLTKKDFSDVTGATVQILDSRGTVLLEAILNSLGTGEIELDTSSSEFDVVNGGRELAPNTTYTVRVTGRSQTSTTTSRSQIWKTLKRKPVLGKSVGYTGNRAYFDLGVDSVEDLDKSIINYRYEIYEADSTTETVIKTIMSDKKSEVPLYISTNAEDTPYIARGKKYRVKVVAIYNDNEKQAEIAAEISDSFMMNETGSIAVSFTEKDGADVNKTTSINGIVTVDPKDASGLLGIGGDKGLIVMVESTGYYKKTIKFEAADLKLQNGVYNLPLELNGLRANSNYRISVWGYVNVNPALSQEYVYSMLGDYVTSTAAYNETYVTLQPFDSTTSAISCYVNLGKNEDPGTLTFTQNAIRAIEVKLYTGSTPQESNFVTSGYVIEDRENPQIAAPGKIAGRYYGKKGYETDNRLEITDSTFGLSPADLTSANYCVQVSAIYDYTKYYNYTENENLGYWNEIPLTADSTSSYALQVNKYVPPLPTPLDSAVDATPITFGQLSKYGITYPGTDKDLYDDDTIVGYHLNAHFDNSGYIAKSVTYYAVTEKDLVDYKNDPTGTAYTDVMLWREQKTSRTTPWMEITIPVQSNSSSLPGVNVMFFEPSTEAGSSLEKAWSERLQDTEVASNKANGVDDRFLGGSDTAATTPTIFAPNLKRGWHYLFTYTTRLNFNGDYRYPNNYTGSFQANKTLLSSGLKDVPRQGTDVKMYLNNTELGSPANVGVVDWKYTYTDLDGAAAVAFQNISNCNDLFAVFEARRTDGGVTTLIDSDVNLDTSVQDKDTDGYRSMKVKMNGNGSYRFWLKQNLYDPDDLNARDENTAQVQTELAESNFVVPYRDQDMGVTITAGNAVGNTLPVKFDFGAGKDDMKNRIVLVSIWAVMGNGNTVPGSLSNYSGGFETDPDDGKLYLNYDLSRAANAAGQSVTLKAEITYDTGFAGKALVKNGSNEYFTVALSDGSYLEWSWRNNGIQAKKNTGAWYANYKVTPAQVTSSVQYKAEEGWKLSNVYAEGIFPEPPYERPVLNLRKSAYGDYEVEQSCYPVFRKISKVLTNPITHIIADLSPSVTGIDWTEGITSLDIEMRTNSYAMIAETTPGGYDAGKYIHVVLKKIVGDTVGNVAWDTYVNLTDNADELYRMTATPLESGASYELSMYAVVNGGSADEKLLLYSGGGTRHPKACWSPIKILANMDITNLKTFDIDYESYTNKSLHVSYGLSVLKGYELEYELRQLNANGTETSVADHQTVMQMMGYENRDGVWGKATGTNGFTAWKVDYQMSENINLAPGGLLRPGNTYRLYVRTLSADAYRKQLGEEYTQFTWSELSRPPFYVTTSPSSGENGKATLLIKINPADENRVIVDGSYIVALWDSNGKCVFASDLMNVDDGIKTLNAEGLDNGASYTLAVYAVMDMDNAGNMSAITKMTAQQLEDLTAAQKAAMSVYTSSEKTMESWGGRFDEIRYSFNDAGYVIIDAYNAYNINDVRSIRMTIYDKKNNVTKSFTKRPMDAVQMFDQPDSSNPDYTTVIQTDGSYTEKGSYAITCEYRDANDQYMFSVTGNATIR